MTHIAPPGFARWRIDKLYRSIGWGKERLSKERNVERLVSLFGSLQERTMS